MPKYFTIFTSCIDIEQISRDIEEVCHPIGKTNKWRTKEGWIQQEVTIGDVIILITIQTEKKSGDEIRKIVLGAHNYFRCIKTNNITAKEIVLNNISKSATLLGIVINPESYQYPSIENILFSIAKKIEGIVFTSHSMLSASGSLLLDENGSSDY